MKKTKPSVIVLIGPTASGKTDLAIKIAKEIKVDIHNIDSRQVYKRMDIGTAKPTKAQQRQIKHYLIDLKEPNEPITLHEFKNAAESSLSNTFQQKRTGFLVGGSGLYMKALTQGFSPPQVSSQQNFRESLGQIGQFECHQILKRCDPEAWKNIEERDSIRTIRALEVFYATGHKISYLKSANPPNWNVLELGLNPSNLNERIAKRTEALFNNGLIEETQDLIERFGDEIPLLQTIGYQEALNVIQGNSSIDEAIKITTKRTNQFAKRQRTWFRRQHNPKWLNEKTPLEEALSLIKNVIGLS